jgi:hypothetical protein
MGKEKRGGRQRVYIGWLIHGESLDSLKVILFKFIREEGEEGGSPVRWRRPNLG